jgi:hypothetical protein
VQHPASRHRGIKGVRNLIFRQSIGTGHLYQGRFKSFPVQEDDHLFTLARYVERNALRANLVHRAEQWRWGSLYRWLRGSGGIKGVRNLILTRGWRMANL